MYHEIRGVIAQIGKSISERVNTGAMIMIAGECKCKSDMGME